MKIQDIIKAAPTAAWRAEAFAKWYDDSDKTQRTYSRYVGRVCDPRHVALMEAVVAAQTPKGGQHDLLRCRVCGVEQLYHKPYTLDHEPGCPVGALEVYRRDKGLE